MKTINNVRILAVVVAASVLTGCTTVNREPTNTQARDARASRAETLRPETQARRAELLKGIKSVAVTASSSVSFSETLILFKAGPALSSLTKPSVSDQLRKTLESKGITVAGDAATADAVLLCNVKKTISWGGAQVKESSTGIKTSENFAHVNCEATLQVKSKTGDILWEKSIKGYSEADMTEVADLSKAILVADGRFRPDRKDAGFTVSDAGYEKADSELVAQMESAVGELASALRPQ